MRQGIGGRGKNESKTNENEERRDDRALTKDVAKTTLPEKVCDQVALDSERPAGMRRVE